MNSQSVIVLKNRPTSITIKKGTKDMLDELGRRRESYDDIVRRLMRENQSLKFKVDALSKEHKEGNTLLLSHVEKKKTYYVIDNRKIFIQYNVPESPLSHFRFDIFFTKVIVDDVKVKDVYQYAAPLEMAKDYLLILQKIIKAHIDSLFNIDKRRLFDLGWWKITFEGLGLSDKSYRTDIKDQLLRFGVVS